MKKQEKKFVLAALALLAITGLLALAGCKNDTVPEPTRYRVKFETDHGTAPTDITVVSGTKLTAEQLKGLADTADYIFEGWYDGETKAEGGTYTVTKDVTLVAKWRDRGTVASVTFTPAGGALDYGDTVTLSSQEGATIHYTVNDGEEKNGDSPVTVSVTGDTTITARATKDGLKPSTVASATYTVRKLEGITVTTLPAQTVYSVGQEFDSTGMVVTATYNAGEPKDVTSLATTNFETVVSEKGLDKTVTVSYKEGETSKTTTFTVTVFPEEVKVLTELEYTRPNNTGSDWTYVEFGEWPQTIKADSVIVGESEVKQMGMFTYYLGSDGNHYVKHSDKYYKVEPIVWRVLTEDYKDPEGKSTSNALLLAESILTGGICYYVDTSERTIGGKSVYANNWQYSTIRAWLNGRYESDDPQAKEYAGKGFLQTAFTQSARDKIAVTSVDNSAASTNPASDPNLWENGENPYASDTPTTDKVFLLSEEEATTLNSGFAAYNAAGQGNTRIRVTTDYAKATGAYQSSTPGYGGWWWLRSPYCSIESNARVIDLYGYAGDSILIVSIAYGGVVPALSISLGGN